MENMNLNLTKINWIWSIALNLKIKTVNCLEENIRKYPPRFECRQTVITQKTLNIKEKNEIHWTSSKRKPPAY